MSSSTQLCCVIKQSKCINMCYYSILKCLRCRQVYPQEYILCENLDDGAICIDKEKLINNFSDKSKVENNVKPTSSSTKPSVVDLFYILRHNYKYTDGCLNCGG